jgi:hypothetical protein
MGLWHYIVLGLFVLLPPLLVLVSKRAAGTEKAIWFLVAAFLSWLGFIAFLIATANRDSGNVAEG